MKIGHQIIAYMKFWDFPDTKILNLNLIANLKSNSYI